MACTVEVRDGRTIYHFHRRPFSLTRRAVERRVQHHLLSEGLLLRKCSPKSRWHSSLGDYYLVSMVHNHVHATHQDLEALAREYDELADGQTIADE